MSNVSFFTESESEESGEDVPKKISSELLKKKAAEKKAPKPVSIPHI